MRTGNRFSVKWQRALNMQFLHNLRLVSRDQRGPCAHRIPTPSLREQLQHAKAVRLVPAAKRLSPFGVELRRAQHVITKDCLVDYFYF